MASARLGSPIHSCHFAIGQLACHDRRHAPVAVFEDLEEIMALQLLERAQAPVIEDEHIDLRKARQQPRARALGTRERELVEQPRDAAVEHAVASPTRALAEGAGHVALSDSGRSAEQDAEVLVHRAARTELAHERFVDAARRRGIDVLDARARQTQLRVLEQAAKAAVVACDVLGIDEEGEARRLCHSA